ncbi:ORF35 [macacine gammaherpesvirus 12]|uniref:ORF35 n=1 Tax=macacine gammaherpesvirus 12 TaxID=2560571 RepID=A0A0B5D6F4_9GAMA|nr:ORF35 [Macaca nemestrina rhadinovirus 2]AJE29678.1 ORF35 [Macaca nemestrina rhadinovirus 2]
MASATAKKMLIKSELESEINKKLSISVFDRFGADSAVFSAQYKGTRESLRSYTNLKKKDDLATVVGTLETSLREKQSELEILKAFNRKKIAEFDTVADAVRDLKDELYGELEVLGTLEDESLPVEEESPKDDIIRWKLERLPRVCSKSP